MSIPISGMDTMFFTTLLMDMTEPTIETDKLIKSLIGLTSQQDMESLEDYLLIGMMELLHADEIRLTHDIHAEYGHCIKQISRLGNNHKSLEVLTEHYMNCSTGVAFCMDSGLSSCTQSLAGGLSGLLIPIKMVDGRCAVLSVIRKDRHDFDQEMAVGVARIYENLHTVFHSSEVDTLTGLLNRKTFDKRLSRIISGELHDSKTNSNLIQKWVDDDRRHQIEECHSWIGVIDIDHFKRINDGYGHLYGDEVLLLLAQLMRKNFRSTDFLFRYGGEEFVIILESTSKKDAFMVFERFRKKVAAYDFPQIGKVTISIGFNRIDAGSIVSEVFGCADKALYYAKSNGRDQVCFYEKLVETGKIEREVRGGDNLEIF